ncbi:unnamed protein product [Arabidopsis arenosa]|uniref:Uncharacterized protein n=1 Tax=Arabidopsis arenosa TaxID=38785 RepID=A0A8S1ZZ10_ARAAE|nr:unnamed protein product [Arabidopsis arenosa]
MWLTVKEAAHEKQRCFTRSVLKPSKKNVKKQSSSGKGPFLINWIAASAEREKGQWDQPIRMKEVVSSTTVLLTKSNRKQSPHSSTSTLSGKARASQSRQEKVSMRDPLVCSTQHRLWIGRYSLIVGISDWIPKGGIRSDLGQLTLLERVCLLRNVVSLRRRPIKKKRCESPRPLVTSLGIREDQVLTSDMSSVTAEKGQRQASFASAAHHKSRSFRLIYPAHC